MCVYLYIVILTCQLVILLSQASSLLVTAKKLEFQHKHKKEKEGKEDWDMMIDEW